MWENMYCSFTLGKSFNLMQRPENLLEQRLDGMTTAPHFLPEAILFFLGGGGDLKQFTLHCLKPGEHHIVSVPK